MNKKTNKLPFILFLPVSIGITLIVSGFVTERNDLLFAGFCVLFGGSFLLAIIITALTITLSEKSKTPTDQTNQSPANDVLNEARRRVDERTGTSSETRVALDKIGESVQKRKRKDGAIKALVILFIGSFIGCALVGVGLMSAELILAGGIVFGCSPLMLLTFVAALNIHRRVSLAETKKVGENYDRRVGRVTKCVDVSSANEKTSAYLVDFVVGDTEYSAYSRTHFFDGDKIEVAVKRNGKRAKIIGRTEYSFVRDREKPNVKTDNADIYESKSSPSTGKLADKPKDAEAEKYMAAIIGSIDRMRGASEIEDDGDEQRAAREAAHQAVIDELNKLKAIRAEAEAKRKERMKNAAAETPHEDAATPSPTDTTPPPEAPATATDETVKPVTPPAEETQHTRPASPHDKRAPVGYKGINRKK